MESHVSYSSDNVAAEYQRLGYELGWRLFTCPAKNIETATVALITINPGGFQFEDAKWSVEGGSAYVLEKWRNGSAPGQSPLQRQITRMFEIMSVRPEDVLSGYLVPFRSRNWSDLKEKKASKDFGARIWRDILERTKPRTVLAFGKDIANDVATLLDAKAMRKQRAGWGEQTIDTYSYADGGKMIILPHLSRFGLFHRNESEEAFRQALLF